MRTLTPGDRLNLKRDAPGLSDAAEFEVILLKKGAVVLYVRPAVVTVVLKDGSLVEVRTEHLESENEKP